MAVDGELAAVSGFELGDSLAHGGNRRWQFDGRHHTLPTSETAASKQKAPPLRSRRRSIAHRPFPAHVGAAPRVRPCLGYRRFQYAESASRFAWRSSSFASYSVRAFLSYSAR